MILAPSSLIQILTRKESRIYGSQVPNLVRLFKHICRNDWKLLNSVNIIVSLRYWRRDNACVWSNTVLAPMFCPLFHVLLFTRNNTDLCVLQLEIQRAIQSIHPRRSTQMLALFPKWLHLAAYQSSDRDKRSQKSNMLMDLLQGFVWSNCPAYLPRFRHHQYASHNKPYPFHWLILVQLWMLSLFCSNLFGKQFHQMKHVSRTQWLSVYADWEVCKIRVNIPSIFIWLVGEVAIWTRNFCR